MPPELIDSAVQTCTFTNRCTPETQKHVAMVLWYHDWLVNRQSNCMAARPTMLTSLMPYEFRHQVSTDAPPTPSTPGWTYTGPLDRAQTVTPDHVV